jgi:hypothetical protein
MKRSGFSLDDFIFVSSSMMNSKGREVSIKVWNDIDVTREGPQMGRIINYLKEKLGNEIVKEIYG